MKRLFLLLFLSQSIVMFAQNVNPNSENICITSYIPEEVEFQMADTKSLLLDKLAQIVTQNGLGSNGYDNRFVISANIHNVSESNTVTIPAKVALKLSLTLYIGDGLEGTLYSTTNIVLKGIGNDSEDAYRSALNRISPKSEDIIDFMNIGRKRILAYYDSMGENIIKQADGYASSGKYDEAMNSLFTIPMQCKYYRKAQDKIVQLGKLQIENKNKELLIQARAAWAAEMDEDGAEQAMNIIREVKYPSNEISNKIEKLCADISKHLNNLSDKRWEKEMKELENSHKEEMSRIKSEEERSVAYINAAASVARTWAANRPKVVYRVYRWWY